MELRPSKQLRACACGGARRTRLSVATPQPCRRCVVCSTAATLQQLQTAASYSTAWHHQGQIVTRVRAALHPAVRPVGRLRNIQMGKFARTKTQNMAWKHTNTYISTLSSQYRRHSGFKCSRQDGKPSQVGSVHTFALSVRPHWGGGGGTSTCKAWKWKLMIFDQN